VFFEFEISGFKKFFETKTKKKLIKKIDPSKICPIRVGFLVSRDKKRKSEPKPKKIFPPKKN